MFGTLINLARRLRRPTPAVPLAVAMPVLDRAPERVTADDGLLQAARVQWHLGDWEALAALPDALLQAHPQRAELALLAASGAQQLGRHEEAARRLWLARAAGADKRQVARILIADVHNSLARACALTGDQCGAERHFRQAVGSAQPGFDSALVAQARARNEASRLAASGTAPALDRDAGRQLPDMP